jgi:XTP/dITP diphosphohydrolase
MFTLLIATGNPGKVVEIQDLLKDLPIKLVTPADVGLNGFDVVEDGTSYAENAEKKARAYCQASGLPVLADDSGLEVDALDGAPGLHSARYAPQPGATDADRRALMLKNLRGKPQPWPARFRCTVAVATPDGALELTEGTCPGEIIPEERGTDGFGYDPIFFIPELGLTLAQISREQKNTLSHRARAVTAAIPVLERMIEDKKA